jgi:hypothetical protein
MRRLLIVFALAVLIVLSLGFAPSPALAEVASCNFTSTHWDSGGRAYDTAEARCGYNQSRTFKVSICRDITGVTDPCNTSSYTQSAYNYSITISISNSCGINVNNIYVKMWITDSVGNQRFWRVIVHYC